WKIEHRAQPRGQQNDTLRVLDRGYRHSEASDVAPGMEHAMLQTDGEQRSAVKAEGLIGNKDGLPLDRLGRWGIVNRPATQCLRLIILYHPHDFIAVLRLVGGGIGPLDVMGRRALVRRRGVYFEI